MNAPASVLGTITTGLTAQGLRIVVGALEKMGKTTLGAGAPGVLLVPLEVGYTGINVAKTNILQSLEEVHTFLKEVEYWAQQGQFPYKTIFFDSATGLERLIHDAVIRRDPQYKPGGKTITMESCHGGYGKGYSLANEEFDFILASCDRLAVHGGINIIFSCHVFASKMMDPTAGEYDSWDLLLHSPKNNKTYGKRERITQWADILAFLYDPLFVSKTDNMSRAMSQNKGRVLGLSRTPAYVAGNRFGITGELPIPGPPANGWNSLAEAIYKQSGIDVYTR